MKRVYPSIDVSTMDRYDLEHEAKWLLRRIESELSGAHKVVEYPEDLAARVENIQKICNKLKDVCHYMTSLPE